MIKNDVWISLVKDLSNTNITARSFTGGVEPTMNPSLENAIKFLKENSKIEIGMFSNGSLLKRFDLFEKSMKVIPTLVDMEISGFKLATFEH